MVNHTITTVPLEGDVWLVRLKGIRSLRKCMIDGTLGYCVKAVSVENCIGIDGWYELGKDIHLVEKIEAESAR